MSNIKIPGYKILQQLGEGGMSTVYLAEQLNFGRLVALKILTANRAETEQFGQRFLREAKIAASLSHPYIVTVHDTGRIDGSFFLAMEYLPGGDLRTRIQNGVPLLEALEIVMAMAEAVDYASEKGVVHRDLKPANVMFRQDGTLAIVDFGIARDITSNTEVTQIGTVLGTPRYMSPEQSLGEPVDIRSDLYSIGIVLYEMLSGNVPFTANSAAGVGAQHITSEVPPLPPETTLFQGIVDKVLAKQPDERYQSGEELIEDIETLREEMPEDLSTTILISKAQTDVAHSLRSSASDVRSKRRRTRSRTARANRSSSSWHVLITAMLVAILVFAAMGSGFYWLSRQGLERSRELSGSEPAAAQVQLYETTSPSPMPDVASQEVVGDSPKLIAMATQALDKAEEALEQGRVQVASDYLGIVESLDVESEEISTRLKLALLERERTNDLQMEINTLVEAFDGHLRERRLYSPAGNSAHFSIEALKELNPAFAQLPAMREKLQAAARSSVKKDIANGQIIPAQRLVSQMKGKEPDALVQSLSSEVVGVQKKADSRAKALENLRQSILDAESLPDPTAVQRGKLMDSYENLLRLQPSDKAASYGLARAVEAELLRAERALDSDDLAGARKALDNLLGRVRERERTTALQKRWEQVSSKRKIAEQQLHIALGVLDKIGKVDGQESSAYHAAQAANLISAYRSVYSAQIQYPALPDLQNTMGRLDFAYSQRFNAFANPDDLELAMVYHRSLSEAKLSLPNVNKLLEQFDKKLEGMKKPRRRSYTTF